MESWFETFGVIFVSLLGVGIGRLFASFRKGWRSLGYFVPLALIIVLAATRWVNSLAFNPLLSWTMGRARFVILAAAVTMGLVTCLWRLRQRMERVLVFILMSVVVIQFCIFPFLFPALIRGELAGLQTRVDSAGICYQNKGYTCAPAAAVTALRRLGLEADEGEIAILSHTSPMVGTLPRCLSEALEERYGVEGLSCEYRKFDCVEELRGMPLTLAIVKGVLLKDHCVTVLKVTDEAVTIADPAFGEVSMSRSGFERIWRFSGIVLRRGA